MKLDFTTSLCEWLMLIELIFLNSHLFVLFFSFNTLYKNCSDTNCSDDQGDRKTTHFDIISNLIKTISIAFRIEVNLYNQ